MRVYLAHPFLAKERALALMKKIEALGIQVMNPFVREEKIYGKIFGWDTIHSDQRAQKIVEGDLREIEETDGVVAMVTGDASIGTHMEVFYAARILHRPVFVLYEVKGSHPWYQFLTKTFSTEQELLQALNNWNNPSTWDSD